MQVRRNQTIIKDLGANATCHGFIGIPIYTSVEQGNWGDHLSQKSCQFAQAVNDARWQNDSSYKDYFYLRDDMRQAYKVAFDLNQTQTDDMTFNDAYKYSDSIFSQRFELDIPQKVNWTEAQIAMINTTQIWGLLEGYTL